MAETSRVYNIIPTPTRVYTCGGYWQVNGSLRSFNVSAFNPTSGTLITGFRGQDDGDTPGCAVRDGVLYIGGHFNVAGLQLPADPAGQLHHPPSRRRTGRGHAAG